MPAILNIKRENLSLEQIKDFFSIFRDVYKIQNIDADFDFNAKQFVSSNETVLDYRPYMGAKFFIQKDGEEIAVWGYTNKDKTIENKLDAEFSNKLLEKYNK